jgi:opacity protein-like surface antigen
MGSTNTNCYLGGCSSFSTSDAYTYKARGGGYAVGWAAGAGVDYAIGNGITVRAEYLYISLGTVSF